MMKYPSVTGQTASIYSLLLQKEQMTAKEIAENLDLFPNAVYRSVRSLTDSGLAQEVNGWPKSFKAITSHDAIEAYFRSSQDDFINIFFPNGITKQKPKTDLPLQVSFIRNRQELIEKTTEDLKNAKTEVNHIVSGLELPADTILAFKQAADRSITLRFLVQKIDEVNREMLHNWQKIGIDVRYFPLLEARIIIFDKQIAYITSYNPRQQEEAIGVRFDYQPIAKLMCELFEKRWKASKPIS